MPEPRVAPFGAWKSPITSDVIVADAIGIGQLALDGDDVYWLETRPTEGGRGVVVRRTPDGQITDVTPPPFNVRTRVHEYGGGAFGVASGIVYFSNFLNQRLYRQEPGGEPHPLTPELDLRYADGDVDDRRGRMVCVREDHTAAEQEATNTVVSLDLDDGGPGDVIVSGSDFYSTPRINPDGSLMAWLSWDHSNMPWDGTELWTGELEAGGAIGERTRVAGGPDESIFQPEWSPDGTLYFVSDRSGWWNLYRWQNGGVEPLCEMEAEFGVPQWGLGMRTYGFASAERIVCSYTQRGVWHIGDLDTGRRTLRPVPTPFTEITRAGMVVSSKGVVFVAGSPTMAVSVMYHDFAGGQAQSLRRTSDAEVDDGYVSTPRSIEFPTERGLTAHGFFYPPNNRDYAGSEANRPPLLVMSHGGPTGTTSSTLNLNVQYWTSRGIAVLDVNYGGSSGYGTEYRRRLNGQWGVVDIDDCVNGATYLVERGEVDGECLAIKGGSAGGYTTLSALTFRDVFKAGASYYGISDLEAMTRDTHKFESRYLDSMIGPYPELRDLYVERSPIHHTDALSCPIILFQGLEDRVVPPNQAEMMVDAMRKKGLPVAYVPFEGEQHGFRRAENIKRALEAELYFYSRVFGFELADPVDPVDIENL